MQITLSEEQRKKLTASGELELSDEQVAELTKPSVEARLHSHEEQRGHERAEAAKVAEALKAQLDALNKRERVRHFTDMVLGRAGPNDGGQPWQGDTQKLVDLAMGIADAFGEDSEQFKTFVEREKERASQAEQLYTEIGSSRSGTSSSLTEWEGKVKAYKDANPSATIDEAERAVSRENPQLYSRIRKEAYTKET